MKAPDKIYIAETPNKLIEIWSDEPIESKPYITEHEYIRKDIADETVEVAEDHAYFAGKEKLRETLLEWLNNRISDGDEEGLMTNQIANLAYKDVIEKLNSL